MEEFTTKERRLLRDLSGTAYERELGTALEEVEQEFKRWREGEIYASELSERIHEFHDGDARELFSLYNTAKPPELVARAIARGFLPRDEVGLELLRKLDRIIGFYTREEDG